MALFRSENNAAGHEVSGLVSKQENLGQAGASYTEMQCERVSPLPGPESPRSVLHECLHSSLHQKRKCRRTRAHSGLCYMNVSTLLSTRREGAGGPEFTQVCAT